MINARLLTRSVCEASQCIHAKLPQPPEASERAWSVAVASTMHAARWSALTALGAVGGSCGQMRVMTHDFCKCIIISCPYIISTDLVVMCGGHGKINTKQNYVFKHSCPIYSQNEPPGTVACASAWVDGATLPEALRIPWARLEPRARTHEQI